MRMAPRSGKDSDSSIVLRTPTNRKPLNSVYDWLEGKRIDDGAEGLWRVHDKLYDLTTFIRNHPGGRDWLEITRGTDITEAFECNHVSEKPERILDRFYVREAKTPRLPLITFHEDGFFRTFKRKVRERNLLPETKPLAKTKLFADTLAVLAFGTAALATAHSPWWAPVSGLLLNMLAVCAHNFIHMRDHWRMNYLNLLLMSVREWRISHALSHHLYPNTSLDLEISMFEPIFEFLPKEGKKFPYLSFLMWPIVVATMSHFQYLRRVVMVVLSEQLRFRFEDLVGFSLFFFMLVTGGQGLSRTFLLWNAIILCGSFFFGLVGLTAAHHHPDIYHDGDFLGNDKDFGVLQLAAVRNRIEVDGHFLISLVTFGDHALHHFFPTVDHGRLPALDGVLEETCREFNISHKPLQAKNLVAGMFRQLTRNYVNSKLMILEK